MAAMKLFNFLVFGLIYGASALSSDWYLASTGTPTVNVGGTSTSEIQLTYEMANHDPAVRVFKADCTTAATAVTAMLQTPVAIQGSTHLTLPVALDIDQTQVSTSNIWRTVDSTTAMIELCVRVDLLDGTGTSYNFNEKQLYVTVDLTQGFTIAAVDVNRDAAGVDNTNANTDYGLTVCQCNQTSICSNNPIAQGDAAFLCIKTTAGSGVEVSSIQQLNYTQAGVIEIPAIDNGTGNGLTDVVHQGTIARVQSQLPSILFDPANVNIPLVGNGVVVVNFGTGRARNLRFAFGHSNGRTGGRASRFMQQQGNEAQTGFSVSMALVPRTNESQEPPNTDANTGPNTGVIIGGTLAAIAAVALIIAALVLVPQVAPSSLLASGLVQMIAGAKKRRETA
ncbi:hypothetical protein MHU86_22006 [Fragilaria crotonensis]|nr:hypothetical protein MHU86_22006 [Fragilaria crotonensis]